MKLPKDEIAPESLPGDGLSPARLVDLAREMAKSGNPAGGYELIASAPIPLAKPATVVLADLAYQSADGELMDDAQMRLLKTFNLPVKATPGSVLARMLVLGLEGHGDRRVTSVLRATHPGNLNETQVGVMRMAGLRPDSEPFFWSKTMPLISGPTSERSFFQLRWPIMAAGRVLAIYRWNHSQAALGPFGSVGNIGVVMWDRAMWEKTKPMLDGFVAHYVRDFTSIERAWVPYQMLSISTLVLEMRAEAPELRQGIVRALARHVLEGTPGRQKQFAEWGTYSELAKVVIAEVEDSLQNSADADDHGVSRLDESDD